MIPGTTEMGQAPSSQARRRDKDDLARLSNLTARTLSLVENTLFMFLSISVLCERTRGNGEMLPGMCSAEKIRLYGDL